MLVVEDTWALSVRKCSSSQSHWRLASLSWRCGGWDYGVVAAGNSNNNKNLLVSFFSIPSLFCLFTHALCQTQLSSCAEYVQNLFVCWLWNAWGVPIPSLCIPRLWWMCRIVVLCVGPCDFCQWNSLFLLRLKHVWPSEQDCFVPIFYV